MAALARGVSGRILERSSQLQRYKAGTKSAASWPKWDSEQRLGEAALYTSCPSAGSPSAAAHRPLISRAPYPKQAPIWYPKQAPQQQLQPPSSSNSPQLQQQQPPAAAAAATAKKGNHSGAREQVGEEPLLRRHGCRDGASREAAHLHLMRKLPARTAFISSAKGKRFVASTGHVSDAPASAQVVWMCMTGPARQQPAPSRGTWAGRAAAPGPARRR